jgi:hypothetical protein
MSGDEIPFEFVPAKDEWLNQDDELPDWPGFEFPNDNNGNAEPSPGNRANITTIVPPPQMSDFGLSSDERPKVAKIKRRAGRKGIPCPNHIPKGQGPDAKPDFWDNYDFQNRFFYHGLCFGGVKPPKGPLLFTMCRILRATPPPVQLTLDRANRWATKRNPNAYAWLDRQRGKISIFEVLDSLREAKECLRIE